MTGRMNGIAGIVPTGSLEITENGTYDVTEYAECVVDVTEPVPDLPPGYSLLNYIQNSQLSSTYTNGRQYLNTGEYTGVNDKIYIKFQILSDLTKLEYHNCRLFGVSQDAGGGTNLTVITYGTSGLNCRFGDASTNLQYSGGVAELIIDLKNKTLTFNGVEQPFAYSEDFTQSQACRLFASYDLSSNSVKESNRAQAKIWSYKHWRNDVLIQDFVPCLNANNVPVYRDVINGTDYTSVEGTAFSIYG